MSTKHLRYREYTLPWNSSKVNTKMSVFMYFSAIIETKFGVSPTQTHTDSHSSHCRENLKESRLFQGALLFKRDSARCDLLCRVIIKHSPLGLGRFVTRPVDRCFRSCGWHFGVMWAVLHMRSSVFRDEIYVLFALRTPCPAACSIDDATVLLRINLDLQRFRGVDTYLLCSIWVRHVSEWNIEDLGRVLASISTLKDEL